METNVSMCIFDGKTHYEKDFGAFHWTFYLFVSVTNDLPKIKIKSENVT